MCKKKKREIYVFPGATSQILQFSSEDIKEDCQIIEVEDGERVAPKLQTGTMTTIKYAMKN